MVHRYRIDTNQNIHHLEGKLNLHSRHLLLSPDYFQRSLNNKLLKKNLEGNKEGNTVGSKAGSKVGNKEGNTVGNKVGKTVRVFRRKLPYPKE